MEKPANLASRMRHRITLQSPQLTEMDGGQFDLTWQDTATVWAEITPLENRALTAEILFGEQLASRVTHQALLRYHEGVSAEMRVMFEGRQFNIRSVINERERDEMLRLLLEENVAV